MAELELGVEVVSEIDAAAVVQQGLEADEGIAVGLLAAAIAAFAVAQGEAIEPFAADQAFLAADGVVFKDEVPADVVEEQLQRPDAESARGAVGKGSTEL